MISAGDLGQDAEGAGLGGAGPGVPIFRVLNQPLLAGIAVGGRVVELRVGVHNVLPRGAAAGRGDSAEQKPSDTTWVGAATKSRAELGLFAAFKGRLCVWMQVCNAELYRHA